MGKTWFLRAWVLIAGAALGACGGGGGGGGGGFPVLGLSQPPSSATTVVLSGTATFESIPHAAAGSLAYSQSTFKPVRGATVEVIDGASKVLAATTTDGNGAYAVSVPANTSMAVRIKAQLLQTGSGASWDATVRDNTQSDALYAMETPAFSSGRQALTRDLRAPSGWDGTRYASLRVAAPFAVLDTVYAAQAKVLSAAPAAVFPPLRVFWSVNNVPAPGDPALGQIRTTFFEQVRDTRSIYILGKEDVDTDEYDASVIAHEWGHYYQSAFSRDDSPGGSHSLRDLLDRRVAFSEGWGNAWSGIALARSTYTDAVGQGQAGGASLDLSLGPASNAGWYREASIQAIFWNLNSQVGFKPIHEALSGSFKTGLAVTSIHPFTAAFNAAAPGSASVLAGLLSVQNISAAPNDPFGLSETSNGGVPDALPMYGAAQVGGGSTSACVTNQAGRGNKLGSFVYLKFNAAAAGNYTITVVGPPLPALASDPDFEVYNGRRIAQANGSLGVSEAAVVSVPAGENVLVIRDYNDSSPHTCFTITIQS